MLSKIAIIAALVALSYAQTTVAPTTTAAAMTNKAEDIEAYMGGDCNRFEEGKDMRVCMRANKCSEENDMGSHDFKECVYPMKWIGKPKEIIKFERKMEKVMRELWGCLDDEWREKIIDEQREMLKKAKKGLKQCMSYRDEKKKKLMDLMKAIGMHFGLEPANRDGMDDMNMDDMDMDME